MTSGIPKVKREKKIGKGGNYVNNSELLPEIIACKANNNTLSTKLAKMLFMIATRYSYKSNFAGYSFREDMVSDAVLNLVRNWAKFDETRFSNPFAYYTQACHYSFLQVLNQEKQQRTTRDELLMDSGYSPSFGYSRVSPAGTTSDDLKFTYIRETIKVPGNSV